jgi:hypothetical protein
MPTIKLWARASTDDMLDAVLAACKKSGFRVNERRNLKMNVIKGSLTASILLGIFVAYANADVRISEEEDDEVKATFQWNNPWWQGIFGPMRTTGAMKSLVDEVEREIERYDGEIMERKQS